MLTIYSCRVGLLFLGIQKEPWGYGLRMGQACMGLGKKQENKPKGWIDFPQRQSLESQSSKCKVSAGSFSKKEVTESTSCALAHANFTERALQHDLPRYALRWR